ncbi:MAG: hypothetical protein R8N23_07160 [Reichenbachiella sp.]|uniref:hypothetical protein n=1 Tax=Reichenbachiella sp. TaxID=2184521 RepID=UPI0029663DA1|nr:hypothetical protein [Reichenbachiella sp.]MDW3209626.1 hypothetical protein [Reichenbachiella sp.]
MNAIKTFWNELNSTVKLAGIIGLILMIYGKLAKTLDIYFFWESYNTGYAILTASIGVILGVELFIKLGIFKAYFRSGWRTASHILVIALFVGINMLFAFSESLDVAKERITNNQEVISAIGQVKGFGFLTTGSSSSSSNGYKKSEHAVYTLIAKGTEAFAEVTVIVSKEDGEDWHFELHEISR